MTNSMRCQDKERLIEYLYEEHSDEHSAAGRTAIEAHLAVCGECSSELADLRNVRDRLADWRTPEIDLGFRVVREPPPTPARSRAWLPVWAALPAAAVLALAVGAAVANLEVRYDPSGVTVRTGWTRGSAPAASPPSAAGDTAPAVQPARASTALSDEAWRSALVDLEQRLHAEFSRTAAAGAPAGPAARSGAAQAGAPQERGELIVQMRALIDESERRQQRELALRLAQFVQDVDSQRRADLVQIEQNIGQIEGLTAAQRDMMQYLVRVSEGR